MEIDSPWKEALDDLLQPFLGMFSPEIEGETDWNEPPESLDNELAKLFPDGAIGKNFLDRLYKVRLRNGSELWVLIHIEVQAQRDDDFPERFFRYFYRIRDKFDLPLMCLVVLADESPSWRPSEYIYEFKGTRVHFTFPVIKLADYRDRIEELEQSENIFALIVLAHLQSQRVHENEERLEWKRRITHNLRERDLDDKRRAKVLRLVDWLIDLPLEWNKILWDEVRQWKERNIMPYVTSFERLAEARGRKEGEREGRQEGRQEGRDEFLLESLELPLEFKFGDAGTAFYAELKAVSDMAKLQAIRQAMRGAESIEALRKLL